MITFFDVSHRKVWSLSVGISNIKIWKSLMLPDKGLTVSKYPISINILVLILVRAIMPPIRAAISISMRGEDALLYKFKAIFIFSAFTSAAATHSGSFRLILFISVFYIFSLLRASVKASQLKSVIIVIIQTDFRSLLWKLWWVVVRLSNGWCMD